MILQRLASAIRHQNWSQIITEILIVVIGIFLGLQVQAWYDGREALKEEGRMVANFITDLESNNEYLEETRMRTEFQIAEGYTVLRVLEGETLAPNDVKSFEQSIFNMGKIRPIAPYLNTVNDDNFAKIVDAELRQVLDRFEGNMNHLDIITSELMSFMTNTQIATMGKASVVNYSNRQKLAIYDFEVLKNDTEFKSSYATILGRVISYQGLLIRLQENSRALVGILKQHQAGEELREVEFQ